MASQPSEWRPDSQVTCPNCSFSFSTQPGAAESDAPLAGGTVSLEMPPGPVLQPAADAVPPGTGTVSIHPANGEARFPGSAPGSDLPDKIGRFEIREFLGEGAFGRVYRAYDPSLKREVALKVARPERLDSAARVQRFQREAQNAAHLLHPHIVAVFDSGQDGPHHYLACAFVEGRPLDAVLHGLPDGQTLPPREAVQVVRKLAEALAYAHKQGVIHRDVKPGNVMLRADGEPLLMDFGLATRSDEAERLTKAGDVLGTPQYMAPEQWRGAAGPTSDQYSLGCVLFELLTGRLPFVGGSTEHYLYLHLHRPVPSLRQVRPRLPRDLDTICQKCLEKEPGQRYAGCQALADDLRRWLEGEPVSVRPPKVIERLVKWTRRNPAVAALLLVTVLGVAGIVWKYLDAEQQKSIAEDRRKEAEKQTSIAEGKEKEAQREADKAKKARDFLVSIFRISETDVHMTARQILNVAEQRIPLEFAEQPEVRADLLAAIEDINRTLGRTIPAAMILEVRGQVQLLSARWANNKSVAPQALLFPEDRLTLAADGAVKLVFLSDLHQEQLKPGRKVILGRKGCEPADSVGRRDNSLMMTFVRLPKGTFYMGWDGQKKGTKTEIKEDFEIAVHTVTQGQWQAVMSNNPSHFSRVGEGKDKVKDISDEELKLFPVENVSWDDAQEFIKKLNEIERDSGHMYRLPTEAEWEYACRGGATSEEECSYHFYFDKPTNDLSSEQANFDGGSPFGKAPKGKFLQRTTRVGAYPPNKLGLCDMHGNVVPWCADLKGSDRVIRGANWYQVGAICVAANRFTLAPSYRDYSLGVRLARVPVR